MQAGTKHFGFNSPYTHLFDGPFIIITMATGSGGKAIRGKSEGKEYILNKTKDEEKTGIFAWMESGWGEGYTIWACGLVFPCVFYTVVQHRSGFSTHGIHGSSCLAYGPAGERGPHLSLVAKIYNFSFSLAGLLLF